MIRIGRSTSLSADMLSSEELAVISALFESNKLRHHWRGFGIETDFTLENGCLHINTHINRDMSRFVFIFLVLSELS